MSEAIWYLAGKDGRARGPCTANHIIQSFKKGQVAKTTLCWREGMPDWLPLAEVEPFAAEVEQAKAAAKRRNRRIALAVGAAACAIATGVIVYLMVMGPREIRQAKKLIAAGLYTEADQMLRPYVKRKPLDARGTYLLAVAIVNVYATADSGRSRSLAAPPTPKDLFGGVRQLFKQTLPPGQKDPLGEARQLFERAFKANHKWREKARTDLAEAMARIPAAADDSPARALAIAQLRAELEVANTGQLARDLLDRARRRWAHRQSQGRTAFEPAVAGLVLQILSWDPSLADQVVSLVLSEGKLSPRELDEAAKVFEQLVQKQPSLAKVLSDTLLRYADEYSAQNRYEHTEAALTVIARISPNLLSEVAQRRIQYLTKLLKTGAGAGVVKVLDRTADESPEMKAAAPNLYFEVARRLKQNNVGEARKAVGKALSLNPDAAANEQDAFLCIELAPRADEAKLTRCQAFVRDYPDSPHRAGVLMFLVSDAVSVFDQLGKWQRNKALPYLEAGMKAANTLIQQYPETDNLDVKVFELAKRLAENKQCKEALSLTSNLLDAVPDSSKRPQIEQARSDWHEKVYGNLPVDLRAKAERVDRELKIKELLTPAEIRDLTADPNAVHVIQIDDNCTVDKFNSQERDTLHRWVENGGILWVNNDVLSIFRIGYVHGLGRRRLSGTKECRPVVGPRQHPILTGCSRVVVSKEHPAASNLQYITDIPLLIAGSGPEQFCYWSLVPYKKGWISNVKKVDILKYDGARFWLNFQLFCLGLNIPETPSEPGPYELPQPTVIKTAAELEKELADGANRRIIWVALTEKDAGDENRTKLEAWVREGGILWVETDLATLFGFTGGGLREARPNLLLGQAVVPNVSVNHPIVSGLSGYVSYELRPGGSVITGRWPTISRSMIPLLIQQSRQSDIVRVICAVRNYGRGIVVLRPAKVDAVGPAGQAFESNLLSFTLNLSKIGKQMPAPRPKPRYPKDLPRPRRPPR